MKGKLILFPVPIGAEDIASSLPAANAELLATCHTFIVEELRTARRFLKKAGYPFAIDDTVFFELNEHTSHEEIGNYLDAIEKGENIGLLSEAAIVMGTESTGLTEVWRQAADAHIRIPMLGQLDSLNVSVSAAILLFEAVRQRNDEK